MRTPDLKLYIVQPKPYSKLNSCPSCCHLKIKINKKKATKCFTYEFKTWAGKPNQEKHDNKTYKAIK